MGDLIPYADGHVNINASLNGSTWPLIRILQLKADPLGAQSPVNSILVDTPDFDRSHLLGRNNSIEHKTTSMVELT